jgi:hypothetical protein
MNQLEINLLSCLIDHIASVLNLFLRDMEYNPPDIDPTNNELEAAMLAELEVRNLDVDRLKRSVHLCASLIEVKNPFSEALLIIS